MAKQKFRPTRLGGFSGAKAYIRYVEVLKKHRNAVGRTFCDAIMLGKLRIRDIIKSSSSDPADTLPMEFYHRPTGGKTCVKTALGRLSEPMVGCGGNKA
jgi:hypothetical protein